MFIVDSQTTYDASYSLNDSWKGYGQSFVAKSGILNKVNWYVWKSGSPTGNVYAKI